MSEFDISSPSSLTKQGDALVVEGLSQEDTADAINIIKAWKDSRTAASRCVDKVFKNVEEELVNCCKSESACPLDTPETKYLKQPGYPAYVTAAEGAEMHNLWHPSQFTEAKAGHVTCTLCGITISSGQEATHGRGRRHSLKAWQAALKPIAPCRGFKWCCWFGCSCRQWHIRSD